MKILLLLLLSVSSTFLASDVILTGKIVAKESQHFFTPWNSNRTTQIRWMLEEGEIVKKGDLVVVFDTANIESEIENEESSLRLYTEQAKEKVLKLEQAVIDAEHGLTQSKLKNKLSILEAGIPVNFRSEYEHESAQFELTKAGKMLELAEVKLITSNKELRSENKKQSIEIMRREAVIKKKKNDLSGLHLYAEQDGPVLHAVNPWYGTKISIGQTVRSLWRVASIAGSSGSMVQAWINEVDWPQIHEKQQVLLAADAYPAISFTGTIIKVNQQAEEKQDWGDASYYKLDISVDKVPEYKLIPGMSIQVRLMDPVTSYQFDAGES